MRSRSLAPSLALFAFLAPAPCAERCAPAELILSRAAARGGPRLRAAITGAAGERWWLFGSTGAGAESWIPLGAFALDRDGAGSAVLPLPPTELRGAVVRAAWIERGEVRWSELHGAIVEQPQGDAWDMDFAFSGEALAAGDVASDSQPWEFFASVSASSRGAPAAAVLVPHPPGGGPDFGLALALAARGGAASSGGAPEIGAGGVLRADFPGPTTLTRVTVVDVLGAGGEARVFENGIQVAAVEIPDLGGTGHVDLPFYVEKASALEVELVGQGAVAEVVLLPHELVIGFDRSTTGVPLALSAGEEVGDEYAGIGIFDGYVWAENHAPGHPDLAIAFDSGHPSGEDEDLMTPGSGAGNRVAHENVLIVAEDGVDADGDGAIDDPDDEAAGGVISVGFVTSTVRFRSATAVDIDDTGASFVRVIHDQTGAAHDFSLANLGDGSVQSVLGDLPTRLVELHLAGSGALAELRFGPIPYP